MLTLLEVIKKTTDYFAERGMESPRLEAELIVGHALGLKRMQLYLQFERELAEPELERVRPLVRRRGKREPWQHIVGEVEWAGLKVKTDRRALIPRPETEYLMAELLPARCGAEPGAGLDLGTGTGAIALAMAVRWTGMKVTGVDRSGEALGLARENAILNGLEGRVEWRESDWFAGLPGEGRFDLIVSNPPYLAEEETAAAMPEVKDFEPREALTAGEAGLADLKVIVKESGRFLNAGGLLALETGIAHHAALGALLAEAGFGRVESVKDLTGRDRFVFAWR